MSLFGRIATGLFATAAIFTVTIHYGQDEHMPWAYTSTETKEPFYVSGEKDAVLKETFTHKQTFHGLNESETLTWASGDLAVKYKKDNGGVEQWDKMPEDDKKKLAQKKLDKFVEDKGKKTSYWTNTFTLFQALRAFGCTTDEYDVEPLKNPTDEEKKVRENAIKTHNLKNDESEARCGMADHCRKSKAVVYASTMVAALFATAAAIAVSNNKAMTAGVAGICSGLATFLAILYYTIGCYHKITVWQSTTKALSDWDDELERAKINDGKGSDEEKKHELAKRESVTEYSMLHISFFLALTATVASFVGGVLVLIAHKRNEPLTQVRSSAAAGGTTQA